MQPSWLRRHGKAYCRAFGICEVLVQDMICKVIIYFVLRNMVFYEEVNAYFGNCWQYCVLKKGNAGLRDACVSKSTENRLLPCQS